MDFWWSILVITATRGEGNVWGDRRYNNQLGVVSDALNPNPNTWEAEVGQSLWVPGQPSLHSEPQDSQYSTERSCHIKQNKTKQTLQNKGSPLLA